MRSICGPSYDQRSTESDPQEGDFFVDVENVTVKFYISKTKIVAQVYPNCMTMAEVKQDISRKFEVDPSVILIKQNNSLLCDNVPIHSTNFDEFGIHEFQLELNVPKGDNTKLSLNVYYE